MTLTGNRTLELIGAGSSGCCLTDILLQKVWDISLSPSNCFSWLCPY